jgi:hypothetical protein
MKYYVFFSIIKKKMFSKIGVIDNMYVRKEEKIAIYCILFELQKNNLII